MRRSELAVRVGGFMVLGLLLLGILMISFSKGASQFTATYGLRLKTTNVGGIIPGARVLMSGVPVGTVESLELDQGTNTVTMHLRIRAEFPVFKDARFLIESAGFLGDQFVLIQRGANRLPPYEDGEVVYCEEPFNLQETARAAAGFLTRIDETAKRLNSAIVRVDTMVLNEGTLTRISNMVANLESTSEGARLAVDEARGLLATNGPAFGVGVTNLVRFTEKLNRVADDLSGLVATNEAGLAAAVKNIESASGVVEDLLADVKAGQGMLGGVLRDEALRGRMVELMGNLATLSSNLNRYGLLYKPKSALPKVAPSPYPGRNPLR